MQWNNCTNLQTLPWGQEKEMKIFYLFFWEIIIRNLFNLMGNLQILLFRLFRYVRNYIPGIVLRYVDYLKRKNLYNFP